jgi:hypothetical protein
MSSVKFHARAFFDGGDGDRLVQLDVWVHELFLFETGKQPGEDWVAESLRNFDLWGELSADMLPEDPKDAPYQFLFKGEIRGIRGGPSFDPEEYEEELELEDVQYVAIPDDWWKEFNPLTVKGTEPVNLKLKEDPRLSDAIRIFRKGIGDEFSLEDAYGILAHQYMRELNQKGTEPMKMTKAERAAKGSHLWESFEKWVKSCPEVDLDLTWEDVEPWWNCFLGGYEVRRDEDGEIDPSMIDEDEDEVDWSMKASRKKGKKDKGKAFDQMSVEELVEHRDKVFKEVFRMDAPLIFETEDQATAFTRMRGVINLVIKIQDRLIDNATELD